jgi:hypothetical protein
VRRAMRAPAVGSSGRSSEWQDTGGAPSQVARRDPRAPRLRSSALGTRPPWAALPGSGPALSTRGSSSSSKRARKGTPIGVSTGGRSPESDPTWRRSTRRTYASTAVPAVRARLGGPGRPYGGPSACSSWSRPASRRAPGSAAGRPLAALSGRLAIGRAFAGGRSGRPNRGASPRTGPRASWGAGVQEPDRGPGTAAGGLDIREGFGKGGRPGGPGRVGASSPAGGRGGFGRVGRVRGGGEPGGGRQPGPQPGQVPARGLDTDPARPSRSPDGAWPPRGGGRRHRQASANGRPPRPARPPAGASRLPRPPPCRPPARTQLDKTLPNPPRYWFLGSIVATVNRPPNGLAETGSRGGRQRPVRGLLPPSRPGPRTGGATPARYPLPEPFRPFPGARRLTRVQPGGGGQGWLARRRLGAPVRAPPWGLPAGAGRRREPGGYRMAMRPADMRAIPLAGLPDRRLGRRGLRRT